MRSPPRLRLIVGHGGSGRTHELRAWADATDRQVDGQVVWLRGSFDHRGRANATRRFLDVLDGVGADDALVVDDAHWLPEAVVERLVEATSTIPVCVARSSWPDSAALRELDDALTVHDGAVRLGPLDADSLETLLDGLVVAADADRDVLLSVTGGSRGLVRLLVDTGFLPTGTVDLEVPIDAVDVVVRRARSSGLDVLTAAHTMTLGADLSTAARLVDDSRATAESAVPETNDLERRIRTSGLVIGDRLIAVVEAAITADMTDADRSLATTLLSDAVDALDPADRARLIHRSGDIHPPEERAAAAVFLGTGDAAASVGALPDLDAATAARCAFVLDMRSMRWERARTRKLVDPSRDAGAMLTGLAGVLGGAQTPFVIDAPPGSSVGEQIISDLHRVVHAFAAGHDLLVCETGTRLVDDAISARLDIGAGWSPAAITGALISAIGRPDAARRLLRTAIDAGLSGPGEQPAHHLLAAHADVACGDFSAALDLVRAGPRTEWQHRDLLLLAALDAAIARRSGDTARLRDAWRRAAPIIERQALTWLLLEPTTEVLAAGMRVGDTASIRRALAHLAEQTAGWDPNGPAAAFTAWTDVQLGVASENWPGVQSAAARLINSSSFDARSVARRGAASVWSAIANRLAASGAAPDPAASSTATADPAALDAVVDALVAVGDAWEASRLLGQIALDHADPAIARSLLERARLLVSDPVEAADGLLAAGLSEREADVARLVAEGRTYKAVGAQLFISAKTVEHHVARIRQRLGAASRAELLAMIRDMSGAQ